MARQVPIILLWIVAVAGMLGARQVGQAPSPVVSAAGYYCGNHAPSHFVQSASLLKRYKEQHGCSGWQHVQLGSISGVVVTQSGTPLAGVPVIVSAADATILATTVTTGTGTFVLQNVPTEGQYQFRTGSLGYRAATVTAGAATTVRIVVPDAAPIDLNDK